MLTSTVARVASLLFAGLFAGFLLAVLVLAARWLTVTALALMLTVVVTTVAFNVPINNDQLGWDVQAPPADWADVLNRWQIAHAVRTAAAALALGCLSVEATATNQPAEPTNQYDGSMRK